MIEDKEIEIKAVKFICLFYSLLNRQQMHSFTKKTTKNLLRFSVVWKIFIILTV